METHKAQLAQKAFGQGCNCAQAVLVSFASGLGLGKDDAMRVACGFGGGMRMGQTCGAVAGAIMVLGLRHGNRCAQDQTGKAETYELVTQLTRCFVQRHGSTCCSELLGCDMASVEGRSDAQRRGLYTSRCPKFVGSAVEIVEGMLPEFSVADV